MTSSPAAKPVSWPPEPMHAVARHDDAERILPVRGADRAGLVGITEPACLLAVADRLAVRNGAQHHPGRLLERRSEWIQWKVEISSRAGEVLLELPDGLVEQWGPPFDQFGVVDRRDPRRVLAPPQDRAQPALAGDQAKFADGGFDGGHMKHGGLLYCCHRLAQRWCNAYERHGRHDSARHAAARGVASTPTPRSALRTPTSVGRNTSGSPRARKAT